MKGLRQTPASHIDCRVTWRAWLMRCSGNSEEVPLPKSVTKRRTGDLDPQMGLDKRCCLCSVGDVGLK
jgi:hypothetical protein